MSHEIVCGLFFRPSQLLAFINSIMCRHKSQQYSLVIDGDEKYRIILDKTSLYFHILKLQNRGYFIFQNLVHYLSHLLYLTWQNTLLHVMAQSIKNFHFKTTYILNHVHLIENVICFIWNFIIFYNIFRFNLH